MQSLGRVLLCQLRSHARQGSPAVSAAGVAAAAALNNSSTTAGALLSGIRLFSSEGLQRLYIGNISFEATQEDVQAAFERFGTVHDCSLPRREDGRHRGFGFVELEAAAAEAAIKEMDQSEIQGRPIHVKVAEAMGTRPRDPRAARERRPRGDVFVRPGFMRLYVGNLSWRTTAADLGRHFQQFGAVQDCVIPLDSAGRSRGYGFVELDDDGAAAAMKALDGSDFEGRPIIVRPQNPQ